MYLYNLPSWSKAKINDCYMTLSVTAIYKDFLYIIYTNRKHESSKLPEANLI